MYVDDSGSDSYADQSKYFILSGIIVQDERIKDLQKTVFDYKQNNFVGNLVDSEIHAHDMYKSKKDFSRISLQKQTELLDNLYEMIKSVNCVGITVVINKKKLRVEKPKKQILDTALTYLIKEYDKFLEENSIDVGNIKIDKSSKKIEKHMINIISDLINNGTTDQSKPHFTYPVFVDSTGVYGIQIADAFAYCVLANKMDQKNFKSYFQIIWKKLRKNNSGQTTNCGYIEYPL